MPKPEPKDSAIRNYAIGADGVNLVKDPLKLLDTEVTQAQNVEYVANELTGGILAPAKRGGLAVLNGSALAGTILGLLGLPLKTTYTKTLYAARQTEDANTFARSTNGTTWTDTSTPLAPVADAKFSDNTNVQTHRRHVAFKNFIAYPGNGYTKNTDNPTICLWDGAEAYTVTTVPIGPSSNGNPPFVIVDMLTANGTTYLAISDPGGSAPNRPGRVLAINLATGQMRQVASAFGGGSGEVDAGAPACLCWYMDQLWVGLNGENTTDDIGKIVRCHPDVDTSWTTEVANLRSHITSIAAFKGDLYATTRSSVTLGARIQKRAVATGVWSAVATSAAGAGGSGHYGHLIVYSGSLYCVEYHATTPVIHIVSSADGTTWGTSRDVDSVDSGVAGNLPGGAALFGSDLYFGFRSLTAAGVDGFIMRLSGGAWTKVLTDNLGGPLVVLTEAS